MKGNKLSVSQVVSLLIYKAEDLEKGLPPYEVLAEGRIIHSRLGYAQPKIFVRYFPYRAGGKVEWWSIGGMPDRLNVEEGKVEELKTFKSESTKKMQTQAGIIQCNIYCWLTGFNDWSLIFYDAKAEKITDIIEGKFDKTKLCQDLKLAIRLQKELDKFADNFKKMAKGNAK